MRFTNRVVVVTGAGSGLGLEVARQFADEGAHVIGADLTIAEPQPGVIPVIADVTTEEGVQSIIDEATARWGRVDILSNNVGWVSYSSALDCSVEEFRQSFEVNVLAAFLLTRAVLPSMIATGSGSIVNTASTAGIVGLRDRAAYCSNKAAVISFTRQVAVQYAGDGVRANSVAPGAMETPMLQRAFQQREDPAAARSAAEKSIPTGRLATPVEVARTILYLSSDDAAQITGTNVVIDGGITAA